VRSYADANADCNTHAYCHGDTDAYSHAYTDSDAYTAPPHAQAAANTLSPADAVRR
jgi:hypothetical protein